MPVTLLIEPSPQPLNYFLVVAFKNYESIYYVSFLKYKKNICVCLCVSWLAYGGERTTCQSTCWSVFCHPTMWYLETELLPAGSTASVFSCWAISLAQVIVLYLSLHKYQYLTKDWGWTSHGASAWSSLSSQFFSAQCLCPQFQPHRLCRVQRVFSCLRHILCSVRLPDFLCWGLQTVLAVSRGRLVCLFLYSRDHCYTLSVAQCLRTVSPMFCRIS